MNEIETSMGLHAEDFPANPVHGDHFDQHVWIDGYGWEYDAFVGYDEDGRAYIDWKAADDDEEETRRARAEYREWGQQ